jgi:hypothetical protein
MSPNLRWVWVAATGRARQRALLMSVLLVIQACTAGPPRPLTGPDPADPDARVPATGYRSTLRDFRPAQPSEPAPWAGGDTTSESKKKKP